MHGNSGSKPDNDTITMAPTPPWNTTMIATASPTNTTLPCIPQDEPYIRLAVVIALPICLLGAFLYFAAFAYNTAKVRFITKLRAEPPEKWEEFILQQCKHHWLDPDVDPKNISKFYGGLGGEKLSPFTIHGMIG